MIVASSNTIVSFPDLGIGPLNLDRFLVEDLFGVFSIAWYGFIICMAMILACGIILYNAVKREGFVMDSFLDYFLITIPFGVIGARVMYVLAKLENYESFYDMIAVWEGGLAIYGGVLTGIVVVIIVAKCKRQNALKVFDAIIPGLLVAQSLGRWGNFINGEAYGERLQSDLPWGMIVNGVGPVHPTFLYESIITFTGFCIAMFLLYRFKKFDGEILCFYLIWYGIGRTLVEGLRSDSLMIGSLRLAQCIGIGTALAGVALAVILILFRTEKKETVPAEGITLPESEEAETADAVEIAEQAEASSEETSEEQETQADLSSEQENEDEEKSEKGEN